jgi:hypothetical protein
MRRTALALLPAIALAACAYILPASWRAFRADPDDAPAAITRALDSLSFAIENLDQTKKSITTRWVSTMSGVNRSRERYIVTWERDAKEETLTIYVRHEQQDQDESDMGAPKWGGVYHDADRENRLLDRIAKELAATSSMAPPPARGKS